MTDRSLYMTPLDEAELFSWGATAWRMDVMTWRSLKSCLDGVEWVAPDDMPNDFEGFIPPRPLGRAGTPVLAEMAKAIGAMVNDPGLVPGISQMGAFSVGGIEIQNGSFDANWHHDGLAGKRMGHAGDFFVILYFGEPKWDDSWGGHFEYATRELQPGWPSSHFEPTSDIRRIAPAERTALIGWNQNPRLLHRSAPLRAKRDRITLIVSLDFHTR